MAWYFFFFRVVIEVLSRLVYGADEVYDEVFADILVVEFVLLGGGVEIYSRFFLLGKVC